MDLIGILTIQINLSYDLKSGKNLILCLPFNFLSLRNRALKPACLGAVYTRKDLSVYYCITHFSGTN